MQGKGDLKPYDVSVTLVNDVRLLKHLDNLIDLETDSQLEIDNVMITINMLCEQAKLFKSKMKFQVT